MKKIILALIVSFGVSGILLVYADTVNNSLSDNLLRMHIISNSSSEYDTNVKLKVRDFLLDYIKENDFNDKQAVIGTLKATENKINEFLECNGVDYKCKAVHCMAEFPKKKYDDIEMPSGNYECIRIILGEGKGENWWCVAYPPLCFTESVSGKISDKGKKELKKMLDEDSYKIITDKGQEYYIRFFIVDFIKSHIKKH